MDAYNKYEKQIHQIHSGYLNFIGLNKSFSKWLTSRKKTINEIFQIQHGDALRNDLIQFLRNEFDKGNIHPIHAGLSTTDYAAKDWVEDIADDLINRLIQYFETTRSQTERDMYSPVPLQYP